MNKLKFGDKIVCVDDKKLVRIGRFNKSIKLGKVYTLRKYVNHDDSENIGVIPQEVIGMKYKIGDKLVCVNDKNLYKINRFSESPKIGQIYTFRQYTDYEDSNGEVCIILQEIIGKIYDNQEVGFKPNRFIKLID